MTSASAPSDPVVLAHSYFLLHDPKQVEKMRPYPPLGTLVTAALLRKRGFRLRFFDAMLSDGIHEFRRLVDRTRPPIVGIFEDNFNFLTKMCTVRMREDTREMIRIAREAGARVAVNGSDATDRPELYLEAGAHAVILGEVEEAALELFRAWTDDRDAPLHGIRGLALPGAPAPVGGNGALPVSPSEEVRRTGSRPVLEELDDLPLPAWDLVDADAYREAWEGAHGRLSWNVVTSRGCPYGCNWCAKPVFGRRYSQRSPGSVARELERLREEVGPDHVWFADDIFGLTVPWIEAFGDEVERRGAQTPFMMQSRVNLMTDSAAEALRRAGCEEVWMGVESGSQEILDAMDKGSRVEEARAATRNLKRHGIRACWFIQLGYLGEGWEEILMTRDLIREERPDDIGVSVAYPLPGTEFFERVRDQMGSKRNWEDSDELAMMFEGTYTTEFYRRVRELLHEEVREVPWDDGEGRRRLDRRWRELARVEAEYRSGEPQAV